MVGRRGVSADFRRALRWALATPLLLLPITLTIDAPDVHGGYDRHGVQAGALAALALFAALAAPLLLRLERGVMGRPNVQRVAIAVAWAPLAVFVGVSVSSLGVWGADWLGGLLRLTPAELGAVPDRWGPFFLTRGVVVVACVAVLLRAGDASRWRRAVAALLLIALGVSASRLLAFRGVFEPDLVRGDWLAMGLAAVVVLGHAWARAPGGGSAPRSVQWEGGLSSALERLLLVNVAFVGSGIGLLAALAAGRALAASIATTPPGVAAERPFGLPTPVVLALVLFGVGAALRADRPSDPHRARDEAAWLGATLIVGHALGITVCGEWAAWGPVLLLAGALRWGPAARSDASAPRWVGWGLPALGLSLGPPLGRTLAETVVPVVLPLPLPAWSVIGGGVVLAVGLGLSLRARPVSGPLRPARRALYLVLLMISPILLVYLGISWGVARGGTTLAVILAAAAFASGRVPLVASVWAVFYACFALVAVFKVGPSAARCADDLAGSEAVPLLLRHEAGGDYLSAKPYDVLPVAATNTVVASFKRIDGRGGFLELIDQARPSHRVRENTTRPDGDGAFWPERLELDPTTGKVWVQMLGFGAYAMWELALGRTLPGGGLTVAVTRVLPLKFEPGNPAIDPARNRMVLTYVPNRDSSNPLAEGFDLGSLESVAKTKKQNRDALVMSDFMAHDRHSGRYYAASLHSSARFALSELEGDNLEEVARRELFYPSVGIAADATFGGIWVTNVAAGTIEVFAPHTLAHLQTVRSGAFPRDMVLDSLRGLLHVGAYSGGEVWTYRLNPGSPRLTFAQRTRVGSLLRGIGLDASTGAIYAASACGIFAIPPPAPSGP